MKKQTMVLLIIAAILLCLFLPIENYVLAADDGCAHWAGGYVGDETGCYFVCDDCNQMIQLSAHDFSYIDKGNATCSVADNVISRCGRCYYSKTEYMKLPHEYEKVFIRGESANYFQYTCSICSDSYQENCTYGEHLTWHLDQDGTLTISGNGPMECLDGATNLWTDAQIKKEITKVVIQNGVTSIDNSAFSGCSNLISVSIAESVMSIGNAAFAYCPKLTSVCLPAAVKIFGTNVFLETPISSILVDEKNPYFSNGQAGELLNKEQTSLIAMPGGFSGHYTMLETVGRIEDKAFQGCHYLTGITVPNNLTYIGQSAFAQCESLCSIRIPGGVSVILENTFRDCGALALVTIEKGVTEIQSTAFMNCGLISLNLPDTVTRIGWDAFKGCFCLKSVYIPSSMAELGNNAFRNCLSLAVINYGGTQSEWEALTKAYNENHENQYWDEKNPLTSAVVSFNNHPHQHNYETLVIAPKCTENGYTVYTCVCGYFYYDNIQPALGHKKSNGAVTAPTCTNTGYTTYTCDCGVKFTDDITEALGHRYVAVVTPPTYREEGYTTYTCSCGNSYTGNYTDPLELPEEGVGGVCGDQVVWMLDKNGVLTISGTGPMYDFGLLEGTETPWHKEKSKIKEIVIQSGVTSIGDYAFYFIYMDAYQERSYISSVSLPDTLTRIGKHAFERCDSLSEISIPHSVINIEEYAFSYCSGLEKIMLSEGLTHIGYQAFYCCSITSLYIPSSLTSLGEVIFSSYLDNITSCTIHYGGTQEQWENLTYSISDKKILNAQVYFGDVHIHWYGDCDEMDHWSVCACGQVLETTRINHSYTNGVCVCGKMNILEIEMAVEQGVFAENLIWIMGTNGTLLITGIGEMCDFEYDVNAGYEALKRPWEQYIDNIKHVIISDGVTSVGKYAFYLHSQIKRVTIGIGVNRIAMFAFTAGRGFDVYYAGTAAEWNAISVANNAGLNYATMYYSAVIHIHQYDAITKYPTCTEKGYTTHTCICGDSYITDEVSALDHIWDDGVVTVHPTEEQTGTKTFTCGTCNTTRIETIPKQEHVHQYESLVIAPTCTEAGYTTLTCRCGDSYITDEVPVVDHTWDDGVVTVHPTEEQTGTKTFTCGICNTSRIEIIPKQEHVHQYETMVTAPTCTNTGYTTYVCVCGDSYITDEVPVLDHAWDDGMVTVHPTEEQTGTKTFTCGTCNTTRIEIIPKQEHVHQYETMVTAPTCTNTGYTTYVCVCGDSYISDEKGMLDHRFVGGNCKVPSACRVCGERGQIKADHDWKPANCRDPKTCRDCGIIEGTAQGHTWLRATCIRAKTCSICGTTDGEPADHIWKEATCQSPEECVACGAVQGDVGSHKCGTWVVGQAPTKDAEGYRYRSCVWCEYEMDREIMDKLDQGKVENWTDSEQNAYGGEIDHAEEELSDILLSEDEKKMVEQGELINVSVKIEDATATLTDEEQAQIVENLGENTVGLFLDISLIKQIGDAQPQTVSQTNDFVRIAVTVPENLKNQDGTVVRRYQVIRLHEGQVAMLDAVYDEVSGKLYFETDAFSSYTLVYKDVQVQPDNHVIPNSKSIEPIYYILIGAAIASVFALAGFGVGFVLFRKRR